MIVEKRYCVIASLSGHNTRGETGLLQSSLQFITYNSMYMPGISVVEIGRQPSYFNMSTCEVCVCVAATRFLAVHRL